LHLAALVGQPKLLRFLIAKRADVNSVENSGRTPFHLALERSDVRSATLLASARADLACDMAQRLMHSTRLSPTCTLHDILIKWTGQLPWKCAHGDREVKGRSKGKNVSKGKIETYKRPAALGIPLLQLDCISDTVLTCWAQERFSKVHRIAIRTDASTAKIHNVNVLDAF
jgi:ankyrin repeat protein